MKKKTDTFTLSHLYPTGNFIRHITFQGTNGINTLLIHYILAFLCSQSCFLWHVWHSFFSSERFYY